MTKREMLESVPSSALAALVRCLSAEARLKAYLTDPVYRGIWEGDPEHETLLAEASGVLQTPS